LVVIEENKTEVAIKRCKPVHLW